jgi:hypothetical protein
MDKIDHCRFIIGRYDHYYDSINNKSAFFLSLNTFVVAGIVAIVASKEDLFRQNDRLSCMMFLILILGFISIVLTLLAAIPYLKGKIDKDSWSLIFFCSISNQGFKEFTDKLASTSDSELEKDYACQAYLLASGLKYKFKMLKAAGILILAYSIIIIPFLLYLITNLKK